MTRCAEADGRRCETSRPGLWQDREGAVMIYVTIVAAVMVGFVGIAIDGGRIFTTNTQAWSAADASAIAAASQLDGRPDAIVRATNAAQDAPLVLNEQSFADDAPVVTVEQVRFLRSLPPGREPITNQHLTTDPREARFAEVTTSTLTQTNWFMPVVGAEATSGTQAVAVAGFHQVVCQTAPLAICNPAETAGSGEPFDTATWRGRQILIKASGAGSQWAPGNFGLARPDDGGGAQAIAQSVARVQPSACMSALIDLKPGQTQGAREAFNVRFDIYQNPFFGGQAKNDAAYRPARNVTKGMVTSGGPCDHQKDPNVAKGLPRDSNFPQDESLGTDPRFGNGIWDCLSYWDVNHPGTTPPPGCTSASNPGTMTRYQLYRHEIDNNIIPNNSPGGEDGNPQCHADSASANDEPDRRMLFFAVINCVELGVSGGETDLPVEAFVKAFMTEPTPGSPSDWGLLLEVIDIARPGDPDALVHDIVQLYR